MSAAALARLLLRLYPRSFRREVGDAVVADVKRRAADLAAAHGRVRVAAWMPLLTLSLFVNAAAAWREQWLPGRTSFSWLDIKLAGRMLVKYPGLSLTGGLGIAIAMAAAMFFVSYSEWRLNPEIPLSEGHRMVGLENWDRRTSSEARRSLHDFGVWRTGMKSVEDLSAFQTVSRNIVAPDGTVEPVAVAEITPSGFRLARVPPLLGRTLVDSDAVPGAQPVVVIGFDLWRTRFSLAPDVVGRDLRLGQDLHTIVGVMPEGFAFPVNHRLWTPLKLNPSDIAPGQGPPVFISGRLAPGYELDDAQAELDVIGARMAAAHPATHAHLRPEVLPYVYPFAGMSRRSGDAAMPMIVIFTLVLVVVCVNVAILVYARTTARRAEMAVRAALGASRGRIVGHMFAESLVLCAGAAAIAAVLVRIALEWMARAHRMPPFWTKYELSPAALAYGAGLVLLGATITGVVPALQITGRRMQWNLQQSGSHVSATLGRTWTALIVMQVAIAVAAIPIALALSWVQMRAQFRTPAYMPDRFIVAFVTPEHNAAAQGDAAARFGALRGELSQRLESETGITDHSFTLDFPMSAMFARIGVEQDPDATSNTARRAVVCSTVDHRFFRTFGLTLLAGRGFGTADSGAGAADVVIVNRTFADQRLPGGNPLGRRIRYVTDSASAPGGPDTERWFEVVGVVEDIDTNSFRAALTEPRVYHPLENAGPMRATLVVRMDSIPPGTAERLRQLAGRVSPMLVLADVITLAEVETLRRTSVTIAATTGAIGLLSVLLLSAAGIYALMSFTVMQRQREIAIRTALGAQSRQLLAEVFRQSLKQVFAGVACGVGLALLIDASAGGEALQGYRAVLLSGMVLVMTGVGVLAALGPARRGLRIEPLEALRAE